MSVNVLFLVKAIEKYVGTEARTASGNIRYKGLQHRYGLEENSILAPHIEHAVGKML
jgi:hypothetical protein